MITIDIVTATRAEYGLMRPLIKRMAEDKDIDLKLLVTGTHLSEKFGMTINEIIEDNYAPIIKIPILSQEDGRIAISETMATAIVRFAELFQKEHPDFLFVDGDRYETLAICIAAINSNIPIIHNGGGCTTEGAADEYYRHAITKMSYLHFTSTDIYRKRIIQMGENPDRVFVVGSLGIENIKTMKLLSKNELSGAINFELDTPFAVVTFHPVTLENDTALQQLDEILDACLQMKDMKYIITGANADASGNEINIRLREVADKNVERIKFEMNLGEIRYLSALKYCEFVLGNSSSGLIEAPSFGIPTVNIGERQKGRLQAKSIINCKPQCEDVICAIHKARDVEFREKCKNVDNPNGDGNTSTKILSNIKEFYDFNGVNLKKTFYNIP